MRRREFVASMGVCGAYVAATLGAGTAATRRAFAACPGGKVVAKEPWGRLEEVAEGAWALISTPLREHPEAHLTVANGGIVAGRSGVAVVEGLVSEEGARWLATAALELTGRRPDHVVLTHHHGDHSSGLPAYAGGGGMESGPILHASAVTLDTLRRGAERRDRESPAAGFAGDRLRIVDGREALSIDLGGRRIDIDAASGHTDSDLFVILDDPRIVWCGDLVWNGLFPNYVDATPSRLSDSVRRLAREPAGTWVPGHGDLADHDEIDRYLALIGEIEDAARRGFAAGDAPSAIADGYRPPESLGEWVLFSPRYYEVAFEAWHRELEEG